MAGAEEQIMENGEMPMSANRSGHSQVERVVGKENPCGTERGSKEDLCTTVETLTLEAAAFGAAAAPERVLILPWGEVRSAAGSFVVDEEALASVIAEFDGHENDLPIDYEHQTLGGPYSSPTGQAPAAGWIKSLAAIPPATALRDGVEPGLWAEVQWTADAADKLRAREYRYLSPVALVRRTDRRVVGLHSAALTNKPAIVGMRPVVASDRAVTPATEDRGLAEDGTGRGAALDRGGPVAGAAWGELRRSLAMDDSAGEDLVLVAAAQRIRVLERAETLRQAARRVEGALAAGKLSPAQREWAIAFAERSPEEFDAWELAAPVLVPLGRTVTPSATAAGGRRRAIEEEARREWRANREFLSKLCGEEAYIAAAGRGAAQERGGGGTVSR